MKFSKKIVLDRKLGGIAIFLLKLVVRPLGYIMKRNHSIPEHPKTIVVAKIVGLGSILYTGLLCRALKCRFPNTNLIYITSRASIGFVENINYIDRILTINDSSIPKMFISTLRLLFRLIKVQPDLYFDMEVYSNFSTLLATLSAARNRYGFYRESTEYKKGLHTHMVFFNTRRHISQIYNQLALCVGAEIKPDLSGLINIDQWKVNLTDKILTTAGIKEGGFVIINPNTSDLMIERSWPEDNWIELIEQLFMKLEDSLIVLVGSPSEEAYITNLHKHLSPEAQRICLNLAGVFSIGSYLALISKCKLLITNDSGPLHFAVALNKPTVSIWGPGSPEHYAPVIGIHKLIYEPVYCSPCLFHANSPPCKGDNRCVSEISVSTIFNATLEVLEELNSDNRNNNRYMVKSSENNFNWVKQVGPYLA